MPLHEATPLGVEPPFPRRAAMQHGTHLTPHDDGSGADTRSADLLDGYSDRTYRRRVSGASVDTVQVCGSGAALL